MAKLKNTYILLGCNMEDIDNRINMLYNICKYENNYVIVLSGNEKEVLYMFERLSSLDAHFLFEHNSFSTIDNIVNTFYYLFSPRRPNISDQYDNLKEIIDYGQIHIVSSEYHLKRIAFICSVLEITKNLNIDFIGCITTNSEILEKRRAHENEIEKNIKSYAKQIKKMEKLRI